MDDYSYATVYATWQAELREHAAADALARRVVKEARRAQRRQAREQGWGVRHSGGAGSSVPQDRVVGS